MKFAKIVFRIAGIWGFLVITPLYFIFDVIGKKDPPPITIQRFITALSELHSSGSSLS